MNSLRIYSFLIILLIGSHTFVHGRMKELHSQRNFIVQAEEAPFSIVLFYTSNTPDRDVHRKIRYLKRDMHVVVDEGLYQNARVRLFALDVHRNDLRNVAEKLGVDQYPTIMLFKGAVPVKNKKGNIVVLKGFTSRGAIRTFIDKNIREDVLDFMRYKQECNDARDRANRTHIYFSYGMTLPASVQYAYPYYYSPDPYYGYAAPGIGVELGF